jgi:Zn-dependent metalloprotease
MKFDTIFEEYIDKQKQFDHLRSAVNQKDEGSQQQEIDTLKTKMDTLKKIQAVELRHAKQTAANEANAMLNDKLSKCRTAYEEEFEFLCKQYEKLGADYVALEQLLQKKKEKIMQLEVTITHQNNLIESRGYFLHREALDHLEPD